MSAASVNGISAVSPDGFEAAVREAIGRANETLRNVRGAWVKDMNVMIGAADGRVTGGELGDVRSQLDKGYEELFGQPGSSA